MERRDATAILIALAGGTLTVPPLLLSGCKREVVPDQLIFFTRSEMDLLEQVADTILPTTPDSPGAREAGIGPFMDVYVADCLDEQDQEVLRAGLASLDQRCREQHGDPFLQLPPDSRRRVLIELDVEAETQSPHYFSLLKGLTLLGYFTSEAGATQALRYVPVPGRYEGDIPYEDGEKAWAI